MIETMPPCLEATDWQWMLSNTCVKAGLPLKLEYVKECMRKGLKHYPGLAVERIINCRNLLSVQAISDGRILINW